MTPFLFKEKPQEVWRFPSSREKLIYFDQLLTNPRCFRVPIFVPIFQRSSKVHNIFLKKRVNTDCFKIICNTGIIRLLNFLRRCFCFLCFLFSLSLVFVVDPYGSIPNYPCKGNMLQVLFYPCFSILSWPITCFTQI
jgi:hypothetical protein